MNKYQVTIITSLKQRREVYVMANNKEEAKSKTYVQYFPWSIKGVMLVK